MVKRPFSILRQDGDGRMLHEEAAMRASLARNASSASFRSVMSRPMDCISTRLPAPSNMPVSGPFLPPYGITGRRKAAEDDGARRMLRRATGHAAGACRDLRER